MVDALDARSRKSGQAPFEAASEPSFTEPTGENERALSDAEEAEELLGEVLGSYRLLALIGRGGMGRVYLAEHVKLGRKVALKLLRPDYAARRESVRRFFQEARAVNTIRHRNIVDVTDLVDLGDGRVFIIMELLSGANLGELMRREGPLPLHRAIGILMQVCDALEAAHREGIVHRDLKPDNIFILDREGERDTVKLLDFGVAKLLYSASVDGDPSLHTVEGAVVGTPAYMSPEQAAGSSVDHRSDIYSLGAIMYELFTGQRVFEAKSFGEFVLKHLQEIPVPPRDLRPAANVPPALESVILRCLEKKPENRYKSVAELRADLMKILAGENTAAIEVPSGAQRKGVRAATIVALAALGLVLGGLAVFALWPARPPAPPPGRSQPSPALQPQSLPALPGGQTSVSTTPSLDLVEVSFRSDPPGARVYVPSSRLPLGVTPFVTMRPREELKERFIFRLPGYREAHIRPSGDAAPEVFALLEKDPAQDIARAVPEGNAQTRGTAARQRPAKAENPTVSKAGTPPAKTGSQALPEAPRRPEGREAGATKKRIDRADTVDPFAE